ncbi:putative NAD-dependent epimerase/dehydrogenase [Renibacterium salmoninarum ATCC 33209]|uniref:Putative NAD-dependent epimerase/dehydrogenase n=1 Tax=Renibacterium salmoninarum (strain ATCC 33209 / DSM 20767 / JCM 11484 / NBRC 15589 / NCIMB 2235) TaxID=288705 RepID=A9WQH4_RENSM|nr:SDR family oxidoreductase [Renibacterium salmoninarum]ABY22544.1 putative NAD-dependent epimerase/dehydrogenase [Renibacterium salmoninarum ATCC 33209]
MKIVIAGGHGQIALFLGEKLAAAGHEAQGLIRKPEQQQDLSSRGIVPVLLDLENSSVDEVAAALAGVDTVVFAAGAGPDSGPERKDTVDRAGSVLLADAAERAGVARFVQISSMGADSVRDGARPDGLDDDFYAYLLAKLAAEDDLSARHGLDWTIVRPGRLTNDEPTGLVALAPNTGRGAIPRADVAAVLVELISASAGSRQILELISGDDAVSTAVAALFHR